MADDITIPASGTGTATPKVATDDVGGSHYQKVKLDLGADGASSPAVGTVPVSDNGGSLTVDGSVAVSGTVTVDGSAATQPVSHAALTELAAAIDTELQVDVVGALPAGSNNIGDVDIASMPNVTLNQPVTVAFEGGAGINSPSTDAINDDDILDMLSYDGVEQGPMRVAPVVYNGTEWDRLRGNIANGLDVDVTRLPAIPAGTNNIGDVDVLTLPSLPAGTNAIGKLAANSGVDIGDVDVTSLPALPAGSNNIGDVDIASSVVLTTKLASATATLTNVNDTNVSTTLLASNSSRLGATIHNDSTAILYVKFGTTASTTSYTVKMVADSYYEVPYGYTGRIDGVWASDASGAARITEMT